MKYCSSCGKVVEEGNLFCDHCGAKIVQDVTPPMVQPQPMTPPRESTAKASNKKTVVILSIVCGLLVVALVALFFVFIYPSLNKPNLSIDASMFLPNTPGYTTIDADELLNNLTEQSTTPTTQITTQTTTAPTTGAPKDLPPVQSHVKNYRVRLQQGVNVRTGAYAESEIIGSLQKDAVASSTAIQGDWVYLRYGTLEGWVHLSGIVEVTDQLVAPDADAITVMRNGRVITRDGDGVNLRYGPSTSYEIIDSVLERQVMYVMYSQNGWYYVEYNGVLGWASSEFVSLM